MKRIVVAAMLALSATSVACSGDDGGSTQETVSPDDTADDSVFAFTSTITITPAGFEPLQAVAVLGETLTFVNETAEQQTITFINGGLGPQGAVTTVGPIAPGQSASVAEPLNSVISLVYESNALPGKQGHLQIDPGVDEL